jgi:hypothetical protein
MMAFTCTQRCDISHRTLHVLADASGELRDEEPELISAGKATRENPYFRI